MEILWKILFLVCVFCTLYGIYLGLSKKAVFYMNAKDLFTSFSILIVLVVGMFLAIFLDWRFLMNIALIIATIIAIYTCYLAFKFNKGNIFYAFCVGLAKVVLGAFYIAQIVDMIFPADNRHSNRIQAMIIAAIITPLLKLLVNGEEVCKIKGWNYNELIGLE